MLLKIIVLVVSRTGFQKSLIQGLGLRLEEGLKWKRNLKNVHKAKAHLTLKDDLDVIITGTGMVTVGQINQVIQFYCMMLSIPS